MTKEMEMVLEKLGDDLSREWYIRRIEAMEGKRNVLTFTQGLPLPDVDHYVYFTPYLQSFPQKQDIIVFGTGETSRFSVKTLQHSQYSDRIAGYCDPCGDQDGQIDGIPVIPLGEASKRKNTVFLVGEMEDKDKLDSYMLLVKFGICQANIFIATEFLKGICGKQYFDFPLPGKDEVFVDCGCLDMGTSMDFFRWCGGDCSRIIAFEPDPVSAERCSRNAKNWGLDMTEIVQAAASDSNGTISFMANHMGSSKILEKGNTTVPTMKIDDALKGDRVTFIKMDIEGAEPAALRGAEETIRRWKPTLAISLYHKKDDVLTIPPLILSMCKDYTLYIRHYSNSMAETVLYAIPEGRKFRKTEDLPW